MAQETGGAEQQINPPSFVPSADRRPRTSAASGNAGSTAQPAPTWSSRATGGPRRAADSDSAVPPAIRPAGARSRRSAAPAFGASAPHDAAADASGQSVSSTPADRPVAPPPSFSPNARRTTRRVIPTGGDAAPQSITPTRTRRSSGSPRTTVRPAGVSSATSFPANATRPAMPSSRAAQAPVEGAMAAVGARPRRHRAAHITLVALAVLLAALAASVFGAWVWVNGKLNKADWLTGTADTPPSTWLILGSDERDGSTDYGGVDDITGYRTDTILVLTKPKTGASSLISIPRDSLMNVDGQYMKINSVAQFAGSKALVGEVEHLTGQKIDHVAQIKFGGLQNVVNALGGVQLCYDQDVQDAYSGLNWQAGCHTADGATALSFSRMRYADAQGDFGRNERQRQVIAAIVKKASSAQTLTNPAKVTAVADAGLSSLTVDEQTSPLTLVSMAMAFKDATGSEGISGSVYWTDPDYYVDGVGSSVLLDDARNTELFSELAAGTHASGTVGTLAEG